MDTLQRKYISIGEIHQEYLPISKKKIRAFVKMYLPQKIIGRRIYIERQELERLLADVDRERFPLN